MIQLSDVILRMQEADRQLPNKDSKRDCFSQFRERFATQEKRRVEQQKEQLERYADFDQRLAAASPLNSGEQAWVSLAFVECSSYSINRQGHVINRNTDKLLPESHREKRGDEERRVKLKNDHGLDKKLRVPRLVAQAFLLPPSDPSWTQVHHRDNQRSNCQADNLFWGPRTNDNHALHLAESAPTTRFPLYDRRHTDDGLLEPFTWSIEIKRKASSYDNEWFPYYTAFNRQDLVKDLDIEHTSAAALHGHEHWAQDIRDGGSHAFERDNVERASIDVAPVSNTLWRVYFYISNGTDEERQYKVRVSMNGLISDLKHKTLGSGQISLQHARHKVYKPNVPEWGQTGPVLLVERMVVAAWLGDSYHKCFLDPDHPAFADPADRLIVHHVDGNIHHNHLYNLLVIPKELTSDPDLVDQLLLSVIDRIEPYWNYIEAQAPASSPGMSPQYARNVIERRRNQ